MKPATDTPDAGQVIETTTRKRVISADAVAREKTTPDFWTYFESLKPSDWERHMLYIYRRESDSGPMPQLEKCVGTIVMPDGNRILLTSREETEYAIVQKYGGGTYRLILKRGSERVAEARIYGEGQRKNVQMPMEYSGSGPQVSTMSDTAEVAHHAISTIAGQERQAIDVAVSALNAASGVVKRMAETPATAPAPSATDELLKQALLVMVQKALNPPPPPPPVDPLDTLTKLLGLMNQMGGGAAAAGATNPTLQKILDAGLEKILNPPATGPVSSAGAELVRQLPQIGGYAVQALSEWRAGVEAQRDTAAMMRGVPAPGQPPRPAGAGQVLQPPLPGPPQSHPSIPENAVGTPSLEFVESRIVQIFREPIAAEEAADRCFEFLDTMDPQLVEMLKSQGEAGLLTLFNMRPVLKPATQNLPRLQEFIKAFLKFASEGDPPAPPVQ